MLPTKAYTGKSKIISVKKLPTVGTDPGPLDHHSYALVTVLTRYVLGRRFLK